MTSTKVVETRGQECPMDLDSPTLKWLELKHKPLKPSSPIINELKPVIDCQSNKNAVDYLKLKNSNHFLFSTPLSATKKVSSIKRFDSAKKFKQNKSSKNENGNMMTPYILIGYLQMLFNIILICGILYLLLSFYFVIKRDVSIKVNEQLQCIISFIFFIVMAIEISQCAKKYHENKCNPDLRVPAMENSCLQWENCMRRDPLTIEKAKLHAKTFAEIINSFIEPISYKTLVRDNEFFLDFYSVIILWNNIFIQLCIYASQRTSKFPLSTK